MYTRLHLQIELHRTRAKWAPTAEVLKHAGPSGEAQPSFRTLFGKTVGMLGYGHIARETARLFKAFHCRIIAANSNGERRAESGVSLLGQGRGEASCVLLTDDSTRLRAQATRTAPSRKRCSRLAMPSPCETLCPSATSSWPACRPRQRRGGCWTGNCSVSFIPGRVRSADK